MTAFTNDFGINLAIAEIEKTYGDRVDIFSKAKTLLKFGRNDDLSTASETLWTVGGNETYVTTNAIDSIVSSSAADTDSIVIEGHTVSGTGADAQYTFSIQTAVLNGQTRVALATPLARVSRMAVVGTDAVAGNVVAYENSTLTAGVPNDVTKVHNEIDGANGDTQSFKAATTFSNTDYFILTGLTVSVNRQQSRSVDYTLEGLSPGGVFRPLVRLSASSTGSTTVVKDFYPYLIVPKNSDLRVVGVSSSTATVVNANFQGFLAQVV